MIWTQEAINLLTGLWVKHNWSASQIAGVFRNEGCTRNAVIGKVSRLGLSRFKKGKTPSRPREIEKRVAARVGEPEAEAELSFEDATFVEPKRRAERRAKSKPAIIVETPPASEPILAGKPVTIFDLLPHHCRWIEGQPNGPETLYCGQGVAPGSSYCEQHATASCGPGTASERRLLYALNKRSRLVGAFA